MPALLFLLTVLSTASAIPNLPSHLLDWKEWVIAEHPSVHCIDHATEHCAWTGTLELRIADDELQFTQSGRLDSTGWVSLPGDLKHWPINVKVNQQHLPVMERDGHPALWINAGDFTITGVISWSTSPRQIQVPSTAGTIYVTENNRRQSVNAGPQGIVILDATPSDENTQRPTMEISRLWKDGNPPSLKTIVQLQNIGNLQQISLGHFETDTLPIVDIQTTLPYWFENEEIWVSVPNGTHQVVLHNTSAINEREIILPTGSDSWPDSEFWAIENTPRLRQVRIKKLNPVAFEQTHLPSAWQHLPAYRRQITVQPSVEEIHRADPTPPRNELILYRTLWPKLQESGFWIEDTISGTMNTPTSISSLQKNIVQIQEHGQIQTILEESDQQLIHLRNRDVNIVTHSDTTTNDIAIQDWSAQFDSTTLRLHLPSDWKLLYWNGWIWTPYTVLLLLNWILGLMIIWRSAGSGIAHSIYGLGIGCGAFFAPLSTLGFQILHLGSLKLNSLRSFLFIASIVWAGCAVIESSPTPLKSDFLEEFVSIEEQNSIRAMKSRDYYTQKQDHNFGIQLGTGLPTWRGQQVSKSWSETPSPNEQMSLWILHAGEQRFLALIAGICILFGAWRRSIVQSGIVLLSLMSLSTTNAHAEEPIESSSPEAHTTALTAIPSDAEQQLLLDVYFPDQCRDDCLSVSLATLRVDEQKNEMTIWMEVHAIEDAILTLPGPIHQWQPHTVTLEENTLTALRRNTEGYIEARIPKGVWSIEMTGQTKDAFTLDWPLKPHSLHIQDTTRNIEGLDETGQITGSLSLVRQTQGGPETQTTPFKPFLVWKRHLKIGTTWRTHHSIEIQDTHQHISGTISLPALQQEQPTSGAVRMEGGSWVIPLDQSTKTISWIGQIPSASTISMDYPTGLTDIAALGLEWSVQCESQYRCDYTGIAPIQHQNNDGLGIPSWIPYPGETLDIEIVPLTPSEGKHLQISHTSLDILKRSHLLQYTLELTLESSQSSELPITLPENSEILSYQVNGQDRNFQQANTLTIFSEIGQQTIYLQWSVPSKDIGMTIPMPTIEGTLSNPLIRLHKQSSQHILWSSAMWSSSPPHSVIWFILGGLMALSLARHPRSTLSFQKWLLMLIGAGHTTPWIWIPLVVFLVLRHYITQPILSIVCGLFSSLLLGLAPLSLLIHHKSLWLWNASDLRWYTDVTNTIPPISIFSIPSWIFNGLWAIWWCWMIWMLIPPLFSDSIRWFKRFQTNLE